MLGRTLPAGLCRHSWYCASGRTHAIGVFEGDTQLWAAHAGAERLASTSGSKCLGAALWLAVSTRRHTLFLFLRVAVLKARAEQSRPMIQKTQKAQLASFDGRV